MFVRTLTAIAMLATAPAPQAPDQPITAPPQCRPAGALMRLKEIPEASGVATSHRNSGIVWALNDSGDPVINAIDANGKVTGRVRITGATLEDWEAIAVGACPGGTCVYVGDIGDNDRNRKQITIYRLPEPEAAGESSAPADVLHATYPDGPHDAESLFIADGALHIVTKGVNEGVALYRFPRELRAGATVQLQRVAKPRDAGKSPNSDRVTDATASPKGEWIVLRTNRALRFHRPKELLAGNWRPEHVVDLADLDEPQGEGVTFVSDDEIAVAGEGGEKSAAGTLARLSCSGLREG
jgi:hypothetical protein